MNEEYKKLLLELLDYIYKDEYNSFRKLCYNNLLDITGEEKLDDLFNENNKKYMLDFCEINDCKDHAFYNILMLYNYCNNN